MALLGLVGNVKRKKGVELPEFESIMFKFKLGSSNRHRKKPIVSQDNMFIPLSPTQAKKFGAIMQGTGWKKRVSTAGGMIHHSDRHVSMFEFYPLGKGPANHKAVRIGIGTKVHHGIAEYLRQRQPTYTVAWEGRVEYKMRRQLKKIGLRHGTKYPVRKYFEIIQRHVERREKQN